MSKLGLRIFILLQQNPHLDVIPKPCPEFKKDMKLEAMDPKHPSYICVCTIVKVKGSRMRLHFDGWSESYDFWTNCDSPFIYPVGWCEKNGQTLNPPRSFALKEFSWEKYLKRTGAKVVPEHLFKPVSTSQHNVTSIVHVTPSVPTQGKYLHSRLFRISHCLTNKEKYMNRK